MKYSWFKVDTMGWLKGSIRDDLTLEQRSVWIDLIALASDCRDRNGRLQFAPGKPMPRKYIADILRISEELLNATVEACLQDKNKANGRGRIDILQDGTIELTNFAHYQEKEKGKE